MSYTVFAPMGERLGAGTYDTFWKNKSITDVFEGMKTRDYVVIDFVKDNDGKIFLQFYHIETPEQKHYYKLMYQHFIPELGIDTRDDWEAAAVVNEIYKARQ